MSSENNQTTPNRGSGRGRGGWRSGRGGGTGGRGGGRGGPPSAGQSSPGRGNWRGRGRGIFHRNNQEGRDQQQSRLTHFLALPIGHHVELRNRMAVFTSGLLATVPSIEGLDESIVVSPRRMHLTLGVMSLVDDEGTSSAPSPQSALPPTLPSAIKLLNDLKPRIMTLLSGKKLVVPLKYVDILKPERGEPEKAHVFWAGPPEDGEEVARLKAVSQLIHDEFKKAGLVVDEGRPLKLHCTVLNTTYRKPRGSQRRPFSYAEILASPAFQGIKQTVGPMPQAEPSRRGNRQQAVRVNLGEWAVDEVQICKMGSWGPEGEYVCAGRCVLD